MMSRKELSVGLGLLLLGFALRAVLFNRTGIWLDECITAYRAMNLHSVFHQNDASPWFYPLVVFGFTKVLGSSELVLRLPSFLAGIALGPAMFFMLRRRWSLGTAAFAGLLGTLNSLNMFYSGEARVYAFAMLLTFLWSSLLQEMLYLKANEKLSPGTGVGFVLLSPMVALSHHYCIYVGAAGFVLLVYRMTVDAPLRAKIWKIVTLAYLLTLVLWFPTLLTDTMTNMGYQVDASKDNPYAPHAEWDQVLYSCLGIVLGPYPPIYVLGLSSLIVGSSAMSLAWGKRPERAEWGWGAQYLLCVLFVIVGHVLVPSYNPARYETVFLSVALVCLSLAVDSIPAVSLRRTALVCLVLFQCANLKVYYGNPPYSVSRDLARYIAQENPDLVLLTLPRDFDSLYLMPTVYYLHHEMGTGIPVVEIPRFVTVPDSFVSPTLHYLLYSQLLEMPLDDTLKKVETALAGHRKVVIVGQDVQLKRLLPVMTRYRTLSTFDQQSLREGRTVGVTLQGMQSSR